MPFSFCCCKATRPTNSSCSSPNVVDVYLDPFNQFELITTQPPPEQQKPFSDDLKKYQNDSKGFNSFAFVDEIDYGDGKSEKVNNINSKLDTKNDSTKNSNLIENIAKESILEGYDNEGFEPILSSDCIAIKNEQKIVDENVSNITINNSVYAGDNNSVNNSLVEYMRKELLMDDNFVSKATTTNCVQQINSTVTITENGITKVYNFEDSPFYNPNNNCIQVGNVKISTNGKILIDPSDNSQISNNNLNEQNFIKNAFQNYIENSGLIQNLQNSIDYNLPIEKYANIKFHENDLMKAIEIPKKIPKRKFPNAFDKKLEKSNDIKRKPSTNLIISREKLLKEIPSDYSCSIFCLSSLDIHNELRAKHGCPPLIQNNELNEIAKDWAIHLAVNNFEIYHRPNNKYGENLYWTSNPFGNAKMAVQAWYDEIELYDYNNPGFSKATGHFTQLLWKDTKELGTAFAKIGNSIWVVCNYNPPGNVQGKFNDFYVPSLVK